MQADTWNGVTLAAQAKCLLTLPTLGSHFLLLLLLVLLVLEEQAQYNAEGTSFAEEPCTCIKHLNIEKLRVKPGPPLLENISFRFPVIVPLRKVSWYALHQLPCPHQ